MYMIVSFDDATTEDLFHGANTKAARSIDRAIWPVVRRKLDLVNAAASLEDLRVPPGNRLEALKGDQKGRHSIRVDDQYRVTFRFENGAAHDVRCEDYH
jgi:proteic killer suppression protein